ncbi:MAG TPA: hypothetical protein PLH98_02640 [Ruminococcus flavefaciens]|nr:hypothetical protein [Ruminococcus flavefaciens]
MKMTVHIKSVWGREDAEALQKAVTAKMERLINIRLRKENEIAESRDILPPVHRGQGQGRQQ